MIQDLYQKAMQFAGEKHSSQQVPGTTSNYLLHISNVVMEILMAYHAKADFDLGFALQLAILHDTLEDTATEFEEIKNEFGENVATGVLALTKNDNITSKKEKMRDSLLRINQLEKEVGLVKLADRITNLQAPPKHWDRNKIADYLDEAKLINTALENRNSYLNNRLKKKISEYEQYTR